MTYIPDLTPWSPPHKPCDIPFVAIGWLEADHAYPQGPLKPEHESLPGRISGRWSPLLSMGYHHCSLCAIGHPPGTLVGPGRKGKLFYPHAGFYYVFPPMLSHYLRDHNYLPPLEFCKALCTGPALGAPRYFEAVLALGGPDWLVDWAADQLADVRRRLAAAKTRRARIDRGSDPTTPP